MIRGIQPILLSKWSPTSVSDLIAVINAYAQPFEIGLMPFFNDKDPWGNLVKIIEGTSVKLNIVIHLAFHSKDSHSESTIVDRAGETYKNFVVGNQGRANISICPMLEDFYTDSQFKDILTKVAKKVKWENHPRLNFRRTNNKGGGSPDVAFDYHYKVGHKEQKLRIEIGTHKKVRLERESHGAIGNVPSGGIYSNDGNFVWWDNPGNLVNLPFTESEGSFPNPDDPHKYSLSHWKKHAKGSRVLLWRPAYNLFQPAPPPKGPTVYAARGLPHAKDTQDSTDPNKNAFNPVEREALRYFLGLLPEEAHKPPKKK